MWGLLMGWIFFRFDGTQYPCFLWLGQADCRTPAGEPQITAALEEAVSGGAGASFGETTFRLP